MISQPWSSILTIIFAVTAALCVIHLARALSQSGAVADSQVARADAIGHAVHVNHLIMSLAMLLMVWHSVGTAVTWVQVVIFGLFAILMLAGMSIVQGGVERLSLVGHVVLNAAMIWMLLAMPQLMAGSMSGDSGMDMHGMDMHGMDMGPGGGMQMESTPGWVSAVNGVAIVLSALVGVLFLVRLLRERGHRTHLLCHLLMGGGMALMLAVM